MIDWKVILLLILIAVYLIVIWFFTIKDIVKGISYLKSQEKTNGTNNNDCDNKPEPECLRYIEGFNRLINCNDKPNNTSYPKDNYERPNSSAPSIIFTHVKRIISKYRKRKQLRFSRTISAHKIQQIFRMMTRWKVLFEKRRGRPRNAERK